MPCSKAQSCLETEPHGTLGLFHSSSTMSHSSLPLIGCHGNQVLKRCFFDDDDDDDDYDEIDGTVAKSSLPALSENLCIPHRCVSAFLWHEKP